MKKLHIIRIMALLIASLFIAETVKAQEVVSKSEYVNGQTLWGLYNQRTNKWILKPQFESGGNYYTHFPIGYYQGVAYFGFCKNKLFAIYDSNGKQITEHEFTWVYQYPIIDLGFIVVQKTTSAGRGFGILSISPLMEVLPCLYKDISYFNNFGTRELTLSFWRGGIKKIEDRDLIEIRDKLIKEKEENDKKTSQAKIAAEKRAKKEKELASFTTYAKNFVEPKINEWQLKGEFEKLADYRNRVTGPNRSAMIDSLTRVAESNFIKENADLHPEMATMILGKYDSENEVFAISSAKFGTLLIDVPIDKAPSFKQNFSSLERKQPTFVINSDTLMLASMIFADKFSSNEYHYSNKKVLSYKQYEIDPDNFEFNVVNVSTNAPTVSSTTTNATTYKKPVVKIISPSTGSNYTTEDVIIRYQVTTSDGSKAMLRIWVNGEEVDIANQTAKGISKNYEEVQLKLPTSAGKACNIMLSAIDNNGTPSENKTIRLLYTGAVQKPDLYLFAVGVSDYASESLTKLSYASKDAQDFISAIKNSDLSMYKGVKAELINDANAKKAFVEKQLANLTNKVSQDDVVMLFFSGHGVRDGEDAYFMTIDSDGNEPYTGVDFNLIRKNLVKLKDKKCRVIIFMDACHSGVLYGGKGARKEITFAEHDIIGFYSSTASQESTEMKDVENGVFTRAVIDALKGKAVNSEKQVTTNSLQTFISNEVIAKTKGAQNPIVENKIGDIILFKTK